MFYESKYQAARIIPPIVESHFSEHLEKAKAQGEGNLAILPDAKQIEAIIDTAFWASLRREEGISPRISLAFLSPEQSDTKLLFEHKIPLDPNELTKLSLGVERPGVHLGVWCDNNKLYVWGITLNIPNLCFIVDVSEPGLLVIKHRRIHGYGKFTNVAVLTGDQIKIVDEQSTIKFGSPELLQSLLGLNKKLSESNESINMLIQLAVSMRSHKHGGILLVVPNGNSSWRESIIHPVKYAITSCNSDIIDFKNQSNEKVESIWQTSLRRELDSIAGLTAIDGATLINDHFELLAFGAKISRANGQERVQKVLFMEPIVGNKGVIINPSLIGGTRHLAAAQFVHDQRDAVAMVASQDGHFTIFSWSGTHNLVLSYRIDVLLV